MVIASKGLQEAHLKKPRLTNGTLSLKMNIRDEVRKF